MNTIRHCFCFSSLFFRKHSGRNSLSFSKNQFFRFAGFFWTLNALWCSNRFNAKICLLKNNNVARDITFFSVELLVRETCFQPEKTEEFLKFFRFLNVFELVLNCSSYVNERNWIKLLFYFIVLANVILPLTELSFLPTVFNMLAWGFFWYCNFTVAFAVGF